LFYLNIELPLFVKSFIYNFRWSIFFWLPNLFTEPAFYCDVFTFKFEQNSLDCSLWRNLGYNIVVWSLLVFYKFVVSMVSLFFVDSKNWYMVKFKRANQRLNGEFLWRLMDAQMPEVMLYIFLYLKIFFLDDPFRADNIAVYVFGGIYLLFIIWTHAIIIMFLKRLNPK
jgi:disulfide bond formation protein DsbB